MLISSLLCGTGTLANPGFLEKETSAQAGVPVPQKPVLSQTSTRDSDALVLEAVSFRRFLELQLCDYPSRTPKSSELNPSLFDGPHAFSIRSQVRVRVSMETSLPLAL